PEPGTEAPALTAQVRRDISGHHGTFNQKGAYTAHGVGQRTALGGDTRPAGTNQYRSCEVFLERRRALLQAITALVQAMPGHVQRQHRLAAIQAQVHAQIRVELVDAGSLPGRRAEPVDDGVLDL